MKILIDGDSCRSIKTAKQIAKSRGITVLTFCDDTRNIQGNEKYIRRVKKDEDAADFALLKETKKGDIVVTRDYGLAAMAMALGAKVLSPDGSAYHDDEIDEMLFRRFLIKKSKRIGGGNRYLRESHIRAARKGNAAKHFGGTLAAMIEKGRGNGKNK